MAALPGAAFVFHGEPLGSNARSCSACSAVSAFADSASLRMW
jgi:hypothetical protein